ncbi:hypothetical protein ACFX13_011060 [Malus domestica]
MKKLRHLIRVPQAQEGADVSGVLTVMTLGMFYAGVARTAFKGESQQSLHHFWEMVAYIANTLIFILSGVVIAEGVLSGENVFDHGKSWFYLILLYVYVQVSRFIVVAVSFPLLRYFGYGLDWKEAIILIWSGLRGAVALSLSLSKTSDSSALISSDTGVLFVFFTGGIVFLTLIVNGSTTQFILRLLDLDKLSAAKRRVLEYTKYEMLNKALEAFGDLGDDEELGPADWPTVKRYIASLNDIDTEPVHPHKASESGNDPHLTNLKDIRERLLNATKTTRRVLFVKFSESSIALVKLFLPQIFEKMAMQDLRTLVAERSVMPIYIRGESFEIPYRSIGFLLEGFVKTQGVQEELITSPAPLFPSHGYQSFQNLETSGTRGASFSHKGSSYLVETRSRVIIFDVAAFESDSALIRCSSSFISNGVDHHPHRSLPREHSGLMSWPEDIFKAKQQKQNPEGIDRQINSLSARAMQFSIYGSMVKVNPQRCARSFLRSGPINPPRTLSYPSMPSYRGRSHKVSYPSVPSHHNSPLVSVRSEGATTVRKDYEARKVTAQSSLLGQQSTEPNKSHVVNDSSDESGGEDDVTVRIDSPGRLSFCQAP